MSARRPVPSVQLLRIIASNSGPIWELGTFGGSWSDPPDRPPDSPEVTVIMPTDAIGPDTGDRPPTEKQNLFLPLFLKHERRLYAYILTLLPNRADADDAL